MKFINNHDAMNEETTFSNTGNRRFMPFTTRKETFKELLQRMFYAFVAWVFSVLSGYYIVKCLILIVNGCNI